MSSNLTLSATLRSSNFGRHARSELELGVSHEALAQFGESQNYQFHPKSPNFTLHIIFAKPVLRFVIGASSSVCTVEQEFFSHLTSFYSVHMHLAFTDLLYHETFYWH